jgi:hypothetical protein
LGPISWRRYVTHSLDPHSRIAPAELRCRLREQTLVTAPHFMNAFRHSEQRDTFRAFAHRGSRRAAHRAAVTAPIIRNASDGKFPHTYGRVFWHSVTTRATAADWLRRDSGAVALKVEITGSNPARVTQF